MTVVAERQAILGLGVTGYSLLRHLAHAGAANLLVVDTREQPPMLAAAANDYPQVEFVCGRASRHMSWQGIGRVYVSPGIAIDDSCVLAPARRLGIPIDSDIGLFLRSARAPVFAVTGTNGKSTVCSLAGHLLRGLGINVAVGGNLGFPALDMLMSAAAAHILELSSFQLERLAGESVHLGAILNIAPDHGDRYRSFEDYANAKHRIFKGADTSLENRQDPLTAASAVEGGHVRLSFGMDAPKGARDAGLVDGKWLALGSHRITSLEALPFGSGHQCANALVALVIASEAGADVRAAGDFLASFDGLPHRMKLIGVQDGVRWIDDSKATNVAAAHSAITSLASASGDGRIFVILGGDAKGADISPLRESISEQIAGVCVLGKDAPRFVDALEGTTEIFSAQSMDEAVYLCSGRAKNGDQVLLSPAAASFDMFENFEVRGRAFQAAVTGLSQ
ncbi:MAG: UDP-N-acetylmuramoyl-L-alanine--D-glutamate ligase [Gammaproteobacteria bacterium]|nr:UDP-N-acetylmuramoyl-L-alanine--D-glutamate ligase [Gammaproteobacteria bacterium]